MAPDWVKSKISVAADELSDIAHFIKGLKAAGESSDQEDGYDDDADPDYPEADEEEE